jgi:hypothetical protein
LSAYQTVVSHFVHGHSCRGGAAVWLRWWDGVKHLGERRVAALAYRRCGRA